MDWVILICLALLYLHLSGGKEEDPEKDSKTPWKKTEDGDA